MTRLQSALKIRPGEGRMAALLIGLMLFTSAGGSIGGNGIEALFFARFGVQFLPYMYMALGVVTLLTSLGVTALLGRVARERLYVALPIALALVLIGERIGVALNLNWFYPVMWLGMNVMGTLQGLLTWGLASAACDTRQAKRLFPLFSAGGIFGAVIGGLGTSQLVRWTGSANLLLVWAGALLIAFVLGRALVGRGRPAAPRGAAKKRTRLIQEMQQGFQFVRRSELMRWLSAAVVLFAVLYFSLTFPFAKAATAEFPDEDTLAGFLGIFQGLSTGGAFLASLFVTNRLFARFGIMSMIVVFPLIYLTGFGVLAVVAAFPALVAFRFIQMLWLSGIAGTAYQTVFNVVPPERRDQVRAFIDGVPGQAGIVIAGLVLLVGEQTLQPQQLYVIGLGTAVATTYLVWRSSRAYAGALVEALRAGQPQLFLAEEEPFGGFQRDAAAVAAAIAGLSHADAVVRRVSAEILGGLHVPEATQALVNALTDTEAQVRVASLRALARAEATSALLEVAVCLRDPEPEVRAQAVETLSQLAGYARGLVAHIRFLLDDVEAAVRARAALALLRVGPDPEARDLLRNMAALGETDERVSALAALGEWGDVEAFELVSVELDDVHAPSAVRRAAATALVRIDPQRALAPLVRALGADDRAVLSAAAAALGQIGPAAVEPTLQALADPALESGALLALERLPLGDARAAVREYARLSGTRAVRYDEWARGLEAAEADDRMQLLIESLRDKARDHGLNALRAIGLLGDRAPVALAIDNLRSRDPAQRANALETLDAVGEPQLVRPLLPLWEQGTSSAASPVADERPSRLRQLLDEADPWLRACAALAADGSTDEPLRTALARVAEADPDPVARDTASAALRAEASAGDAALPVMERVLFLRRVPLFAELPPAELKRVAAIARELSCAKGDPIAREGEPGSEMYIIVSGEVRVITASEGEVARRKPGEYVGEIAIIAHEPRMASLVAGEDVRLLCLDRSQFEGLLRERPEVSLAVVRVLCARLREMNVLAQAPAAA